MHDESEERMKLRRNVVMIAVLCEVDLAGAGFAYWKQRQAGALPEGIVSTNGRVEATRVDIATKIAGRVIEIVPQEGDIVAAGSVVARLDQQEIEAQLRQAEAEAAQARKALATANSNVASRKAELTFATQQFDRAAALVDEGWTTREKGGRATATDGQRQGGA
jgi:HlyD family secretion protein